MAVKTKEAEATQLAIVPNQTLSTEVDYGDYAGAGIDDIGMEERLVPLFRILQPLSPQCDEQSPTYNPDAKPGMIVNSVTGELYDGRKGVEVVAVKRQHDYLEYTSREHGGGFHGFWKPHDEVVQKLRAKHGAFGKLPLPAEEAHESNPNNELVETYSLFVNLTGEDGITVNGMIPFTSTQIKKYKAFTTKLLGIADRFPRGKAPPMFAFKWLFQTQPESNKKGKFYGWRINLAGGSLETAKLAPNSEEYLSARRFYEMIESGAARADFEGDAARGGTVDEEGPSWGADGGSQGDSEIPF